MKYLLFIFLLPVTLHSQVRLSDALPIRQTEVNRLLASKLENAVQHSTSANIKVTWFCPSDCGNINYGILAGAEISNCGDQPETVSGHILQQSDISLFNSIGTLPITAKSGTLDESDPVELQPGELIVFAGQYRAQEGMHISYSCELETMPCSHYKSRQ